MCWLSKFILDWTSKFWNACVISPFVKFYSEMASKGIIVDLNNWEKLDGENYNIWHYKIQYLLNEQEVLETLTHSLSKPNEGSIEQHQRDLAAYESWCKKDLYVRFTMLSSMHNDLIGKFKKYTTT